MDFIHEKPLKLTLSDVSIILELFDKYIASSTLKKKIQNEINGMVDSLPIEKVVSLQGIMEKHHLEDINLEDVIKFRVSLIKQLQLNSFR